MLGPEKCLDSNSFHIIAKFFAVPTVLVKRMHESFAIATLLRKPPAQTTPMDHLLILRAFLLCTHVHLVTQESQLCSCLRKCKWNANRYHNEVHCTYCKHRTKRRISGIESPLHSCWDKITVKSRRAGFRNPWNPPLAPWPGNNLSLMIIRLALLATWLDVSASSLLSSLSYSTTGAAFFSSAFFGVLLTDRSKEKCHISHSCEREKNIVLKQKEHL